MLPRSSSLVPLLLLQDKGRQRKQQSWHHPPQSPSHSSAAASDDDDENDNNDDRGLVDATNDFWTESEASSTRRLPNSDNEASDAGEDSSDQEEILTGHKDSKLDPGSGFESESESDGSDTSQTLDDPIASDIRPRPTVPLHTLREESVQRLANAWLDIFTRYGKETSELPPDDEIDLRTGELIVDNGVLASQSRTLFGTLTKLGQELKGPLEEEQRNMRRRMRKAALRAEIQLKNQRAKEHRARMKMSNGINKSRGRNSDVNEEEPTYGGDDFDNLLYIPTPAATSSGPQDLSQPQQLDKQHRNTGDASYGTVEQTHVSYLSDNEENEHDEDDDDDDEEDGDEDEGEDEDEELEDEELEDEELEDEEREDEEYDVEQELGQVEKGTEENDDEIDDRNSDTQVYLVADSTLVHDHVTDLEDAQRPDWEASEDEYSSLGEDLNHHSVQGHLQEKRLESERPDDESRITMRRPVASDTQPFSVRSAKSTFRATWDDAGVRSSSLTWTAEPILRSYHQRNLDNEGRLDDDQEEDEDKGNHTHGDSTALTTNGAARFRSQWSPPPPLTPPRSTPARPVLPPSTPPRRDQARLLNGSPYLERSTHLRTQMTPRARALANSLMTKGASPSSPGSTPSSTSLATSATPSPSPPPPPPPESLSPFQVLKNPFSSSTITISSMKRTRSSPDPQLDPTSLQGYSESFINNIPEQELDLDLDRGFLGMNLESPLKRKRTDPDLMLEPDQQSPACGGPGICSKDFCFKCL